MNPPFAYHAGSRHPLISLSRQACAGIDPDNEPVTLVELEPGSFPPFGIITTQSCDIEEEGDRRKIRPWVQIAPVYELPNDDGRLGRIRAWGIFYMAPATALGPNWVADLRIEIPVEKSWLALQEPRLAFATIEEAEQFGSHCARLRSRPAMATSVYAQVRAPLEEELNAMRRERPDLHEAFFAQVKHLFLSIDGDRLAPRTIQLIFVSPDDLLPDLVERLNQWWDNRFGAEQHEFVVLQNRYLPFRSVPFAESRTWIEVDFSRLATGS